MTAVRDFGGEGPAALLIHGLDDNLEVWQLVGPLLAQRYRVVAVDLPGFGHSAALDEKPILDTLATALDGVVDDLGLDLELVIGHSFGSTVGAHLVDRLGATPTLVVVDGFVADPGAMLRGMGADEPPSSFFDPGPFTEPDLLRWLEVLESHESADEWPAVKEIYRRSFVQVDHGLFHLRPAAGTKAAIWRELWEFPLTDVLRSLPKPPRIALSLHPPVPDSERWLILQQEAASALGVAPEWFDTGHAIPVHAPKQLAAWIA
jgi:pimeloyl-ACP methyl ester carboxylesterase